MRGTRSRRYHSGTSPAGPKSVQPVVLVCLSGVQTAKEPRRTSLLRIKMRESGGGGALLRPDGAEPRLPTIYLGLVESAPGSAHFSKSPVARSRFMRAR